MSLFTLFTCGLDVYSPLNGLNSHLSDDDVLLTNKVLFSKYTKSLRNVTKLIALHFLNLLHNQDSGRATFSTLLKKCDISTFSNKFCFWILDIRKKILKSVPKKIVIGFLFCEEKNLVLKFWNYLMTKVSQKFEFYFFFPLFSELLKISVPKMIL